MSSGADGSLMSTEELFQESVLELFHTTQISLPKPQTALDAIQTIPTLFTLFEGGWVSEFTNNFENLHYDQNLKVFRCPLDLQRIIEQIESRMNSLPEFEDIAQSKIKEENDILKAEIERLNIMLELLEDEDKKDKKKIKALDKENINMKKTKSAKFDQENEITSLKKKIGSLQKANSTLADEKLDLQLKKMKEIEALEIKIRKLEINIQELKDDSNRAIASLEARLAEKSETTEIIPNLRQSSKDNQISQYNEILKLKDDILAYNKKISEFEKENRILRKSLILSYYEYGSLTARKLLDVLGRVIYEEHASTIDQASLKSCKVLKKDLSLNNDATKRQNNLCLDHFKECSMNLSQISGSFKNILEHNSHLNMFVHSIDSVHEIVISGKVSEMNQCAELLTKILKHLKNKFPEEGIVAQLPSEVIKVSESNDRDFYKKFSCYQKAVREEG